MSQPSALPIRRYADAYRAAAGTILLGTWLNAIGIVVALIMAYLPVVKVIESVERSPTLLEKLRDLATVVVALLPGVAIFVIGVIVAALGQILRATIDTVINTSTLLTNEQRVELFR
jgi:hypothetical protein